MLSHVWLCDPMDCSMPGFPVHHQLQELAQTHVHQVDDAIQPSVFQWVSTSDQVAKVLEFQLQHQSFQCIVRTVSFRMDWLDLLAVQGTLKSLLQQHSSKALIVWCSVFFYGPTLSSIHDHWKNHSFVFFFFNKNHRQTFVGKEMSLLFNMSRLVIAFLPRSKHLLISWLQSPSAVILEPKKIKSVMVSIVSPSICHKVMGPDAMILVFWMLSFKPTFSLSSFTFIKRLFSSSSLSAIRVVSSAYLRLLMFLLSILIPLVLHPAWHFAWCTLHIN